MGINVDPIKFEILKMAKQVIMQEYIDRRAQDHNKWLVESDHLWRTQRLRLAYPDIPTPPTEIDIVERARIMLEFIGHSDDAPITSMPDSAIAEPVKEQPPLEEAPQLLVDSEIAVTPPLEEVPSELVASEPEKAAEQKPEILVEQPAPESGRLAYQVEADPGFAGRILPSVLKKIEEFRIDRTR